MSIAGREEEERKIAHLVNISERAIIRVETQGSHKRKGNTANFRVTVQRKKMLQPLGVFWVSREGG